MTSAGPRQPDPAVGLCSVCRHASVQASASGPRYWRCRRSLEDPAYSRYPPLPVRRCPGFEPRGPQTGPGDHTSEAACPANPEDAPC